ncbi:MAG: hypothetical protein PHQ61_08685, partial [Candidatus Omnitrophica bacterium]|nr:hypothetical protein [Candidatus Omnitrophota bacterium]
MDRKHDNSAMITFWKAALRLEEWVRDNGYASYDHYDIWVTKAGINAREMFKKNKYLGLLPVLALQALDILLPETRSFFAEKKISAEGLPYMVTGYFRLYEMTGDNVFLERGIKCLEWLSDNAIVAPSGTGWGFHFDWPNREFVPKWTPCVTLTAYSTAAFLKGYELTGNAAYREMAIKTADLVMNGLTHKEISSREEAVSYTLGGNMFVVNANSYAAKILYDVNVFAPDTSRTDMARKIVNYILSQQNDDGSWSYWDRGEEDNFIDGFHMAFIIENLFSAYKYTGDRVVLDAVIKGYTFYREKLMRPDHSWRHFYTYNVKTGIKYDIRSQAEGIYCSAMLSDVVPNAMEAAVKSAEWTLRNMRDKKGFFYFRAYGPVMVKAPYIRWGQGPMF